MRTQDDKEGKHYLQDHKAEALVGSHVLVEVLLLGCTAWPPPQRT